MTEQNTGPPAALLDDVKDYLNITWQDDKTDKKITGYISRGMKRLQDIAGASLDFEVEDQPRSLLLDYCRYANSQALEVFETNFQAELLELNLTYQAPIIDKLTVIVSSDPDGGATVKVAPVLSEGDSYVYQVGSGLALPGRLDTCLPENGWTPQAGGWAFWDGGNICAASGQQILLVEINDEYGAERAGTVTVP